MANLLYQSQYKTTSLSVVGGIDASQTTDIVIQSTSGVEASKPGIACLSYTDPLNLDNAEYIEYSSINTTTKEFQGVVRGAEGYAAKTHSNGVTVAFPVSKSHINRINDKLQPDGIDILGGLDGWIDLVSSVTVTRQSTDDPTVILRFDADVTDYIWKGMRIKATENSIVHYFIVSADPVFSSPNTDVTCLSEIDTTTPTQAKNLIGATTISDVAYAPPKTYPKGFPISPLNWTVQVVDTTDRKNTSVSSASIYSPGSLSIDIPVGSWGVAIQWMVRLENVSTPFTVQSSLSTASNTLNQNLIQGSYFAGTLTRLSLPVGITGMIELASKTTYYPTIRGAGSTHDGEFRNNDVNMVIKATSTLL